jgi:hypothetical protein
VPARQRWQPANRGRRERVFRPDTPPIQGRNDMTYTTKTARRGLAALAIAAVSAVAAAGPAGAAVSRDPSCPSACAITAVTDGTSNTIAIAESARVEQIAKSKLEELSLN